VTDIIIVALLLHFVLLFFNLQDAGRASRYPTYRVTSQDLLANALIGSVLLILDVGLYLHLPLY
jgi:hypothetical protein